MPQANASLIAATITPWPSANIGNLTIQQDPGSGDLRVTGVYKGTQIAQDISIAPPCLLFIDTTNGNLNAVKDISQANPTWELVNNGVVKGITV